MYHVKYTPSPSSIQVALQGRIRDQVDQFPQVVEVLQVICCLLVIVPFAVVLNIIQLTYLVF